MPLLPSHRPCERELTHPKANQPEACNFHAMLGMAAEVMHVNCRVNAAPKQKEQQPDLVLARDSNHFTTDIVPSVCRIRSHLNSVSALDSRGLMLTLPVGPRDASS